MTQGTAGATLTRYIYDPVSVAQAVRDYAAFLVVTVVRQDEHETELHFTRIEDGEPVADLMIQEFLNYVLDLAVRTGLSPSK